MLRLFVAVLVISALVKAGDFIIGSRLECSSVWKEGRQEPRERILWDARWDGSPLVIVGDSALSSYYVDHPGQTLWTRVSARLGVRVFPAVLNGALPADILLVARRVASLWPRGTVALIGVHPAHVFTQDAPYPSERRYAARFGEPRFSLIDGQLCSLAADHLFVVRHYDRLQEYLQGNLKPEEKYFGVGVHRDRRWNQGDSFARERFDALEKTFEAGTGNRMLVSFDWIRALGRELSGAGVRPVFVLTPLNGALLQDYAGANQTVPRMLKASRTYLLGQLTGARLDYLDLYSLLDSASFADLLHANARGDDRMAEAISRAPVVRKLVAE